MATLIVSRNPLTSIATGTVSVANSTQLSIVAGSITLNYFGYGFTYSGVTVSGGTVTATNLVDWNNGGLQYEITGLSHSAVSVYDFVTNNPWGLPGYLLNGNDTINGSEQADRLEGYAGNDTISADGGDDTLLGGAGNDNLSGGNGNDMLEGGLGDDVLNGGDGDDTYGIDSAQDSIADAGGTDSVIVQLAVDGYTLPNDIENATLTGAMSTCTGNSADNHIVGNWQNNLLYGAGGNDTLVGDGGVDTLVGGAGDDTYVVDSDTDTLTELASGGTDSVESSVTLTLGSEIERLVLTGTASIDGSGNTLDNTLIGNFGANVLDGGAGADDLRGGLGDDTYVIDAFDSITDSGGNDTIRTAINGYALNGIENLELIGSATDGGGDDGANRITGNALNNSLGGSGGNDTLDGAAGADTLAGGTGDDVYVVDSAADTLIEISGAGIDTVQSPMSWTLSAEIERLTLTGTSAIDGVGNALDNQLTGNSGNNLLDGGIGADTMTGGLGDDSYVVDNSADSIGEGVAAGVDDVRAAVTYTLPSNLENLLLTGSGDLAATGNAENNIITGNAGNNALDGAAGADTLIGGPGDDSYRIDNINDSVIESSGQGIDLAISTILGYALPAEVENLTLIGAARDGAGNALANHITGNDGQNRLDGGAGADTLEGGRGSDVYIVDNVGDRIIEAAGQTAGVVPQLVSVSATNPSGWWASGNPHVSGDGRYVVFSGDGDTTAGKGYESAILHKDLQTGTVTRVAHGNLSALGNHAGISADGRYVVFDSDDHDLLAGDTADVFVKDMQGGIRRISTSTNGVEANGASLQGSLSADGRYVVFSSTASNLGTDDSGYVMDVFVKDLQDGSVERISSDVNGIQGNDASGKGSLSPDGRYVAFFSGATNLMAGGGNGPYGLFVKDRLTGAVEFVSSESSAPSFAGDSRHVLFTSYAGNLVAGDVNNSADIFVKNLLTGAIECLSSSADGTPGNSYSDHAAASADGRFVVFESAASNLVDNDTNGAADIFVKEVSTGAIVRVSAAADDVQSSGSSVTPSISADGRYIVFASTASNLVPGGHNGTVDIFRVNNPFVLYAPSTIDTVESSVSFILPTNVEHLTLTGTAAIDGIGNDLPNLVAGNDAANQLDGGAGADTLAGGLGDDTYIVEANGDVVIEAASSGTDTVRAAVSHTLAANVETLFLTGSAAIDGGGNDLNNLLVGNSADNTLDGGMGDDTLDGGVGIDIASFALSSDQASLTEDVNGWTVISTLGTDRLLNIEYAHFSDRSIYIGHNLAPVGSVAINGAPLQGQSLTADPAGLADPDGLGAFSYQWRADGSAIGGATSDTFILTEAQVGKTVSVSTRYTDGHGTVESVTSGPTNVVANINDAPLGEIRVNGTPVSGQTLTAVNHLHDPDGNGTATFQWQNSSDGTHWSDISGATGATFAVTADRIGQQLRTVAGYTDGHGTAESVSSAPISIYDVFPGRTANLLAYSWKSHVALGDVTVGAAGGQQSTTSEGSASFAGLTEASLALNASRAIPGAEAAATDQAVNLQDAIAVLKMIVGLDANGAGKPLSPYQAYAADFDGNGAVNLSDAIGVLKHVVGLTSPAPRWEFFNEDNPIVLTNPLAPGSVTAPNADFPATSATVHLGLVGVLRGDVDGSFVQPTGSAVLPGTYFTDHGLDPTRFGIY